jgi:mono/diheme cytochrome c family protein
VLTLLGLVVVYTGSYNVAATEDHVSLTRWALNTTQHTSVDRRADGIKAPQRFTPEMIATGARMYKDSCQHCHSGPGVTRAGWASGMRPRPPHLAEAAAEWKLEEVFWLAKHGIKMTGMPAFGPTHQDQVLWNVAAFVKQLPAMTPEEYAAFGDSAGSDHSHGRDAH